MDDREKSRNITDTLKETIRKYAQAGKKQFHKIFNDDFAQKINTQQDEMKKSVHEATTKIKEDLSKYYEQGKERFAALFSEQGFWDKVQEILAKAGAYLAQGGRDLLIEALTLYYCMRDGAVPRSVKMLIVAALGYLILPIDLIPDLLIPIGFLDDLAVLGAIAAQVKAHITEQHTAAAKNKIDELFPKR